MNLLYRSAFEIAADIKTQRITSREVLEFFLHRVATINPQINAVVALDEERALARADEADIAASAGEDWGPLHGVPLTIKDAFCTEGLVTVGGIPECREHIPSKNAVAVQRYIDAGAIVFGKTNVPFMSSDLQSFNEIYGATNNPWNTQRTCGGSSGGAAAALAAGLTPLELGSDIGGSIRTPAHFNGVYGHKPSFGLVPQRGHLPPGQDTLSDTDLTVVGPLATCVADLEGALDIIAGAGSEDASAWRIELATPTFSKVSQLRVALWSDDEFCPVDPEIAACIESAGATLTQLGASVDTTARPNIDPEANHINYIQLLMASLGGGMPESVHKAAAEAVASADPADMSEPLLQMRGISISHKGWLKQNERRLRTRGAWSNFFEDFDVLLCPCTHVPAFPHDHTMPMDSRQLTVNGQDRPYMELLRWAGLTLNAYLPATAAPIGITQSGLPIGVQIVAPFLGDKTSLAVAKILEKHHRSFTPPPNIDQGI
ncbi:MAG: amidase [Halioglobus sp.]